ncbi:MAG: hypothetical protein LQ340_005620, partial [Diploschistes diacapsis]
MPASALSYGLNLPKKPSLASRLAAQPKRKTIFDDGDDDGDDGPEDGSTGPKDTVEVIDTFDAPAAPPPSKSSSGPKPSSSDNPASRKSQTVQHGNLSASHSAAKAAVTAQSLDPSVYSYDEVYDSLHAKPAEAKGPAGPKYMANLLAAAEIRKRDQLRAKEKMLAKEREAEGEEFADKEKFVTGAYRAQQEEVRRLEEEEREREKMEAKRKRGMG